MASAITSVKGSKKLTDTVKLASKPPLDAAGMTAEEVADLEEFKKILIENAGKHAFDGVDE